MKKYRIFFYLKTCCVLVVKFSIYLNRHAFVMWSCGLARGVSQFLQVFTMSGSAVKCMSIISASLSLQGGHAMKNSSASDKTSFACQDKAKIVCFFGGLFMKTEIGIFI